MSLSIRPIAGALFLAFATATAVHAHAHLVKSEPGVDAIVSAPHELVLHFSEQLEGAFSGATVTDARGAAVSGKATVDANDKKTMRVPLKPDGGGTYKVNWHALSVDTHKTQGSFSFTVKP
jgi:methionine-rich copper-binding protein CopC